MKFDGRWRLKGAAVWYNFNVSARSECDRICAVKSGEGKEIKHYDT